MGRDMAESDREVMELWKKAERAAVAARAIYWEGDEASMADTGRCSRL